jgi:mannose-6-phosphate isomerase-like protein (cupin superfamily)
MTDESDALAAMEALERPSKRQKGMTRFEYKRPEDAAAKVHVPIANSDIMYCAVQVVGRGGKTNLHSHTGMDGLWYVLSGRVRFYNQQGLVGEFGRNEGVFVPRGTSYWFENVEDEPAEVLQAEAMDRSMHNERIDHEPRTRSFAPVKVIRGASRPV